MVITQDFVLERLRTRKEDKGNEHFLQLEQLKKEHKELRMQVHGTDVIDYIVKIEGLENETKIKLRKRLSKSNRAFWSDVLGPTNKIFSKQGGSKDYSLEGDNLKRFKAILSTINEGSSFNQWLKSYFVDKYVIDPNGFFMIEHDGTQARPVYKSVLTVADYQPKGMGLEWVIFEPKKCEADKEIYDVRVYDDSGDYTYRVNYDSWVIELIKSEEKNGETIQMSFPNPWGKVPAVLCSDIEDTIRYGYKRSIIYPLMEDAMEYLRINSVNTLQYYHHGFLKFWKHGTPCKRCSGEGRVPINGQPNGVAYQTCPSCNGRRVNDKEDVSDVTYVSLPKQGQPAIAPHVMGYVEMPVPSLEALDKKCKESRDNIYHSHWGTVIDKREKEKTAYEVSVNTQPMQDKLNMYTDSLENVEMHLVDLLGEYFFPKYKGSSINYGRNYIIKGAEQLLEDYYKAKEKKASYTVLNEKLIKYYNAMYSNDPKSLQVAIKLMHVEPWVHNTIEEVTKWDLSSEKVTEKIFYNDWLSTIKREDIVMMEVDKLKTSLSEFVSKMTDEPTKVGDGNEEN